MSETTGTKRKEGLSAIDSIVLAMIHGSAEMRADILRNQPEMDLETRLEGVHERVCAGGNWHRRNTDKAIASRQGRESIAVDGLMEIAGAIEAVIRPEGYVDSWFVGQGRLRTIRLERVHWRALMNENRWKLPTQLAPIYWVEMNDTPPRCPDAIARWQDPEGQNTDWTCYTTAAIWSQAPFGHTGAPALVIWTTDARAISEKVGQYAGAVRCGRYPTTDQDSVEMRAWLRHVYDVVEANWVDEVLYGSVEAFQGGEQARASSETLERLDRAWNDKGDEEGTIAAYRIMTRRGLVELESVPDRRVRRYERAGSVGSERREET